jgi:hypothetical protein
MTYDKEQAIEWMKSRGYSHTATNGSEDLLYFLRKFPDGHIHLHATIWLKKQTVELDTTSVLDLGISLYCPAIQMDTMKFESFEERMYNYAYLCLYGKTNKQSGIPVGIAIPNASGPIHTRQPTSEPGTESTTVRGREPGGALTGSGKPEKPTIEERKKEFWIQIKQVGKSKNYEKQMCEDFYRYWIEMNPGGKKMRWEMEKVFDITRRLSTWIQNDKKWLPIWKQKEKDRIKAQDEELKNPKKTLKHKDLF